MLSFNFILIFLFLLGLVDIISAKHVYHGWFPNSTDAEKLPADKFDSEMGIHTIPQYWLSQSYASYQIWY